MRGAALVALNLLGAVAGDVSHNDKHTYSPMVIHWEDEQNPFGPLNWDAGRSRSRRGARPPRLPTPPTHRHVPTSHAVAATSAPIGVEFSDWPLGTIDFVPRAGGWVYNLPNGTGIPASIDARGWPTQDAFFVVDYMLPSPLDPLHPMPVVAGDFSLSFVGKADLVLGPGLNVSISNVVFNATSWSTSATVTIEANASIPGLALGFFNSYINSTAGMNTGVRDVRLLQPGYTMSTAATQVYTNWTLAALAPFAHARMMSWTCNNYVIFYNASEHGRVEWENRRHGDDAMWVDGVPNALTFGAPWESVISLAVATGGGSWNAVPVQATGGGGVKDNTTSYVYQLASLLLNGNNLTGGVGLPSTLYVEHGNECWYNTSESLLWNEAAAVDEVQSGTGPWNTISPINSPYIWGLRRHISRLYDIALTFDLVWGAAGGMPTGRLRPVLGWGKELVDELPALFEWHTALTGVAPSTWLYGVAINTYRIAYFAPGVSENDLYMGMMQSTDAEIPARAAIANITATYGVKMVSYEGSTIMVPADDDGPTFATVIQSNRDAGMGDVMRYDYHVGWTALGGAEYNFFGLSSIYDLYQWGLTDDLRNLSTVKWTSAASMAMGGA